MPGTRIYLDRELISGQELSLPPEAYHHTVNVLRHPVGARLSLFNGDGCEHEAQLIAITRKGATVRLLGCREPAVESSLETTLVQAVIKGERMDYALQKAVELGVTQIRPLLSERIATRLRQDHLEKKLRHWARVIVSACEQSGRTRIPTLLPPLNTVGAVSALDGQGILLSPSARSRLGGVDGGQRITVFVGPEGGFSDTELGLARDHGITIAGLGTRVLRAETAPVVALTLIQSLWGDMTPDRGATTSAPAAQIGDMTWRLRHEPGRDNSA